MATLMEGLLHDPQKWWIELDGKRLATAVVQVDNVLRVRALVTTKMNKAVQGVLVGAGEPMYFFAVHQLTDPGDIVELCFSSEMVLNYP